MPHEPTRRTLTAVGLPDRKEQLIKSMLLAVSARTVDTWDFSDGLEADVAICDVDSPLASITVARARLVGRPQCIWLAAPGIEAPAGRRLDDPIGWASLAAILDEVSGVLGDAPPRPAESRPAEASLDFATTIRDLVAQAAPARVIKAGIELHVLPATATAPASDRIRTSHVLSGATLKRLTDPAEAARIERPHAPVALPALAHDARSSDVLWLLGLASGGERLLAPLTDATPIALKQWPDFGRLTPVPAHLQATARLVRRAHTVGELAAALSIEITAVRAFVNAAALCGLVDTRPLPAWTTPAPPSRSTPTPAPARSGILASIRSALGF
jgi:hypothetical protein